MMHDMMGSMMAGTGFVWLLVALVLMLGITAVVKYLFFR